jgi:hypothetical protein
MANGSFVVMAAMLPKVRRGLAVDAQRQAEAVALKLG